MVMHKYQCTEPRCEDKQQGYINYIYFKECTMSSAPAVAYILLIILLLYFLFLLGDTADEYFCPALQSTVTILKLSPNIAGVTFLSFGNGAPDVFSSLAAFTHGTPKIGIGALVGAGIVVTMGVAGAVAVTCDAKINRRPFLRDCFFYILAVTYLMIVFFDGEVYIGEALGFLAIYFTFVIVVGVGRVVYLKHKKAREARHLAYDKQRERQKRLETGSTHHMPLGSVVADGGAEPAIRKLRSRSHDDLRSLAAAMAKERPLGRVAVSGRASSFDHHNPVRYRKQSSKHWALTYMTHLAEYYDPEAMGEDRTQPFLAELGRRASTAEGGRGTPLLSMDIGGDEDDAPSGNAFCVEFIGSTADTPWYIVCLNLLNFPANFLRRLTVPLLDDDTWNFWFSTGSCLFGLTLFVQVAFGLATPVFGPVPWGVISTVIGLGAAALCYFKLPRDRPPTGAAIVAWIFFAFVISVVWIIILANEIVGLLLSLGLFWGVSNTILGLTVLAWGNSLGDLVADVTVAKEGLPAMAIAGCFAGPMFNMLMGLGLSCSIATLRLGKIDLGDDTDTVNLSFLMLLISLVSSIIVVPLMGFRFTRIYGFILITVYFVFLTLTILLQTGVVKFNVL